MAKVRFLGKEFPLGGGGYEITDSNGTRTRIFVYQGIDLVVQQIPPGKTEEEAIYLAHYSDPGHRFFGSLLKFLWMHHTPIPKLPKSGPGRTQNETGINVGWNAAFQSLPTEYVYHLKEETVQVQPMYTKQGKPELDFVITKGRIAPVNAGRIRLTVPVVQALVRTLPRLYPRESFFHAQLKKFEEEIPKYKHQQMPKPRLGPWNVKQLQFEFMKQKQKAKPRPKKRATGRRR